MISSVDPNTQRFLSNMDRISEAMARAQRQINSGKRVTAVSDDPTSVTSILQVRAALASTQQINQNLGRTKTEVDSAEQNLQSAVAIMQRVAVLGVQGATTTQSADSRQAIATEVGSLLEELGGISGSSVEGRYLFSGDKDQVAPYSINLSNADVVGSYAGSAATRQVQHPDGSRFSVAKTAQEIFDAADPTQNVFHSVDALRTALAANDTDKIGAALANVKSAGTYLNKQLAFYGTAQNRVSDATDFGSKMLVQLQTADSQEEDADVVQAIVTFQQAQTQQQAALQVQAKLPRTSLFDFLA